jgi:hypothetical protein
MDLMRMCNCTAFHERFKSASFNVLARLRGYYAHFFVLIFLILVTAALTVSGERSMHAAKGIGVLVILWLMAVHMFPIALYDTMLTHTDCSGYDNSSSVSKNPSSVSDSDSNSAATTHSHDIVYTASNTLQKSLLSQSQQVLAKASPAGESGDRSEQEEPPEWTFTEEMDVSRNTNMCVL